MVGEDLQSVKDLLYYSSGIHLVNEPVATSDSIPELILNRVAKTSIIPTSSELRC